LIVFIAEDHCSILISYFKGEIEISAKTGEIKKNKMNIERKNLSICKRIIINLNYVIL
jgi:hypothetical protein